MGFKKQTTNKNTRTSKTKRTITKVKYSLAGEIKNIREGATRTITQPSVETDVQPPVPQLPP